jgi:DNA repair photolyase
MTMDQYSNCSFRCVYCFAAYQRGVGKGKAEYQRGDFKAVNPVTVKRIFTDPETSSSFGPYVKARKALQWGGMSDPFCNFERKHRVGLDILRTLRDLEYPICFSTKGVWWLDDPEYVDLFKGNPNWNVKISIVTLDAAKAKVLERGVPSPGKRLDALQRIAELDCGGATLRLRPFMFGISEPRHLELIQRAGEAGATALSTEFFCLEQRSINPEGLKVMSNLAGYDYAEFYRRYSAGSGYLRLNRNIKRPVVDAMEQACADAGMRFYISDAHFKERCEGGSCCGLPEGWNYSRGQFTEAVVICRAKGEVRWPDIAWDMDYMKETPMKRTQLMQSSKGRAQFNDMTLYEYMRWLWNNPKAGQAPFRMFEGVMTPTSKDEDGDLVYTLDRSRL